MDIYIYINIRSEYKYKAILDRRWNGDEMNNNNRSETENILETKIDSKKIQMEFSIWLRKMWTKNESKMKHKLNAKKEEKKRFENCIRMKWKSDE